MFKVESKIKLRRPGSGRPAKYPFRQMKIGDSFFVPSSASELGETQKKVVSASNFVGYVQMKFVTRQEPGGVRCWRTA